jgi:TPR repeat protein
MRLKSAIMVATLVLAYTSQAEAQTKQEFLRHFDKYQYLYSGDKSNSSLKNKEDALKSLYRSAEKGDQQARLELGLYYIFEDIREETTPKKGVSYVLQAANSGHQLSRIHACLALARGWNGSPDWALVKSTCNFPEAFSEFPDVEAAYAEGLLETAKTSEDYKLAGKHIMAAVQNKSAYVRFVSAKALLLQQSRDSEKEAFLLFQQAALYGIPDAMAFLADYYLNGIVVEKDEYEAERLYHLASISGAPYAIAWRKGPRSSAKEEYDRSKEENKDSKTGKSITSAIGKNSRMSALRESYSNHTPVYIKFTVSCRVQQSGLDNCITYNYRPTTYMAYSLIFETTEAYKSINIKLDDPIDIKHHQLNHVFITE